MKESTIQFSIIVILFSIIFYACSSTNLLTLSVVQPPPVYISSNVETIGIIDRSMPSDNDEAMDKIDKILTAEGKNLDKDGAQQAILGLYDELNNCDQFTKAKIVDSLDLRSSGVGTMPSALSKARVEEICLDNNLDALFTLSFYDTDAQIDYKAVPVEINGPMGIKIAGIEHHATIFTEIETGWRIYDNINKTMADKFLVNEQLISTGKGINPMKAAEAIIGRKAEVMQLSRRMGHQYALRVIPYSIRVSRDYYVRGTDSFEIGKRRAQTGNWDGAAELWSKEVNNPKPKIAGRACYNMAIINEINGNLVAAHEWAAKSYTDYNNKLALKYVNILKKRIRDNEQLEQSLR